MPLQLPFLFCLGLLFHIICRYQKNKRLTLHTSLPLIICWIYGFNLIYNFPLINQELIIIPHLLVNDLILIVDDDYDIASLIRIGVEKMGFSASSFTDPSSALDEIRQKPSNYEVVISDIRMPDMNGYELVKQVKKLSPKVNVILMTAFEIEDKEFDSISQSIKIDGFLQKPFSMSKLNDILKEIR
jgi:CheY-like chemotaxis protein